MHTMKMVIDLTTHRYVRAILNGQTFDMSAIEYHYAAGVLPTRFRGEVMWYNDVDAERSADLDCVIITQNEP